MYTSSKLLLALLFGSASALAATPVFAAKSDVSLTTSANDPSTADGPAATLRAQILLDRARFAPGEIDGQAGSNLVRALSGYQAAHGLDADGKMGAKTWASLNAADTAPVLVPYTLTAEDIAGPYVKIPEDMEAKAALKSMGFESLAEALGERFHASPALLKKLNPDADFHKAGTVLQVPGVATLPALPKAAKLVVDKSDSTLSLLDAGGKILAQFPASSGSSHDPLPIGEWKIQAVAQDPSFHYNPELFWDADPSHSKATIAPGPNNPVGLAWIDLSKPHYGIHGTAVPASIGKSQSHGCVRLSNWDVAAVAAAVDASVPVVMQE
jgi:lipoprotein-anchoring transpeptidase ErfK/SrfK